MSEPSRASTAGSGTGPTAEERSWAMLAHLSALAGLVMPMLGNMLGPLLVWRLRREQSPFVAAQAREALNFNISVTLAALVSWLLVYVFIGVLLEAALLIAWLASTVIAAIRAGEGVDYRYPVSMRLLR